MRCAHPLCGRKRWAGKLSCPIVLFQGLPKGDKMEMVIQKNVELGVHAIVPVSMKRCVVKLDEKKAQAKQKRWQQISEAREAGQTGHRAGNFAGDVLCPGAGLCEGF